MFHNFRRFGRICSVISVGSVRFGSVTGFIHSRKNECTILNACGIAKQFCSYTIFIPFKVQTSRFQLGVKTSQMASQKERNFKKHKLPRISNCPEFRTFRHQIIEIGPKMVPEGNTEIKVASKFQRTNSTKGKT